MASMPMSSIEKKKSRGKVGPAPEIETDLEVSKSSAQPLMVSSSASTGDLTDEGLDASEEKTMEDDWSEEETSFSSESRISSAKKFGIDEMDLIKEEEEEESEEKIEREKEQKENKEDEEGKKEDEHTSQRSSPTTSQKELHDPNNDTITETADKPTPPKLFPPNRISPLPPTNQQSANVDTICSSPDGVVPSHNVKDGQLPFSTRVEAWSKGEKRAQPVQDDAYVNPEKKTEAGAVVASFLTPYKESPQHEAYIPMQLAKQYIEKIVKDMETMRSNHYKVVEQIEEQYRLIEMDSQKQFNDYVLKLRDEYRSKVTTFKHVIEVQQKDFQRKQEFYEKAIKSLREKNRSLLLDKRNQLQKMKENHQNHEEEKTTIVSDLTGMCDKQYRELVALRKQIEEIENSKKILTKIQGEKAAVYDMLSEKIELIGIQENQIKETNVEMDNKARKIEKLESQVKALEKQVTVTTGTSITALVPPAPVPLLLDEQVDETAAKEQSAEPESAKPQGEKSALYDLLSEKINIIDEKDKVIDETNQAVQMKSKVIEKLQSQVRALEKQVSRSMSNRSAVDGITTPLTTYGNVGVATEPVADSGVGGDPSNVIGEKAALYELLNEKIQLLDERDKQIEESNNLIAEKKKTIDKLTRQVKMFEQMTGTSAVIEDPTMDDTIKELNEEISRKTEEVAVLEEKVRLLNSEVTLEKEKVKELEERIEYIEVETKPLTTGNINTVPTDEPSVILSQEDAVLLKATSESVETSVRIAELSKSLEDSKRRLVEIEADHEMEISSLKKQVHKLDKKLKIMTANNEQLIEQKRTAEGALRVTRDTTGAEMAIKDERIAELKKELDEMKESSLGGFPADAREEVRAVREKLEASEEVKKKLNGEVLELKKSNGEFMELIGNMEIKINALKVKEVEMEGLIEFQRKYKDLKVKFKKLEAMYQKQQQEQDVLRQGQQVTSELTQKVNELEMRLKETETKHKGEIAEAKKEAKGDGKALSKLEKSNEILQSKVDALNTAAKVDAEKVRDLDQKLKDAIAKANDKNTKKLEKNITDLQKKVESEEQRTVKLKEEIEKEKAEIRQLTSEIEGLQKEKKIDKDEIARLKLLATEGEENAEKVKDLTKENKVMAQENKIFAENFHSERILRKKYYNMVEDMKGKIRVYCRARPLSRSELDRGNYNIISSPDEYTLAVQTGRGTKEFQYDAVFTAEHTQTNVFEDTNRLIQSAVDGYNVCIFAYGQTGSGKTFTMIGDKEQKFPGIAPRSFNAIYSLIEENITKYSFKTTIYMMELYRDNLIDLFAREGSTTKLDIKKDKKGMVVVQGAITHEANSSEELMELFEKGSSSRHVASTKMNAESSRSHLVLSVVIESTNLTSGAVLKGKLSLVDLAGSERASKTEASAEQLKEAQSINKSLSALGDVISALSSEQSFVPYRNNKLTMLMQDSLGGNAKTLMFVNISPADYNMEETLTSLTYASRVKLITNDASKNSESKEIAKLKAIIAKLKGGDHVTTDEEILSDVND